jgi:predicted ATPase
MNFIRLSDHNNPPEFFKDNLPLVFLGAVQHINIIVGANNSRKSRFLRHIIQQEHKVIINYNGDLNQLYWRGKGLMLKPDDGTKEIWLDPWLAIRLDKLDDNNEREKSIKAFFHRKAGQNQIDATSLRTNLDELVSSLSNMAVPDNFKSFYDLLGNFHAVLTMGVEVYENIQSFEGRNKYNNQRSTFQRHIDASFPGINPGDMVPYWQERLGVLKEILEFANELKKIYVGPTHPHVSYLPVLRTARKLEVNVENIFETTLRKQYKISEDSKLTIETGLNLYEKVGLARNGSRSEIQNFHTFEQFIGDTFFQGKTVHIVARRANSADSQHIHISLPDEREDVTIQELGDGIQGVIALLFPIFTAQEGSWILIDEPENHLHPGFQLIFIQALAANPLLIAKKLTYFINTHSNHILSESL